MSPHHIDRIAALNDGISGVNGLSWGCIEPRPGDLSPLRGAKMQQLGAALKRHNRALQLNLRVDNPWALERDPTAPPSDLAGGNQHGTLLRIKPGYLANWRTAVRTLLQTLDVACLQIGCGAESEWLRVDGFIEALCAAYHAAKAVNPHIMVLAAGFDPAAYFAPGADADPLYASPAFQRKIAFVEHFLAQADGCYDVLTFHASRSYTAIQPTVDWLQRGLVYQDGHKPIWIDDLFSGVWFDDPLVPPAVRALAAGLESGEAEAVAQYRALQARLLVKKTVEAFASGVERVFLSSDMDYAGTPAWRHAGLLDAEGNPKPAYHTYKLLIAQLERVTAVHRIDQGIYQFRQPGGRQTLVAWDDVAPRTVNFAPWVDGGALRITPIITAAGVDTPHTITQRSYQVALDANPVFVTTEG